MESESSKTGEWEGSRGLLRGARPLPLNSRKITTAMWRQIANALEVPGPTAAGEVRLMVEGKFRDMGKDPANVQVHVTEVERGNHLKLVDDEGEFLSVDPPEPELPSGENSESGDVAADGNNASILALEAERDALQLETDSLKEEVATLKLRVKELWKANCVQLSEFDEAI